MSVRRECVMCHTPIENCMGFVKASDFVAMVEGKRPVICCGRTNVRELCGRCVALWMWCGDILLSMPLAASLIGEEL